MFCKSIGCCLLWSFFDKKHSRDKGWTFLVSYLKHSQLRGSGNSLKCCAVYQFHCMYEYEGPDNNTNLQHCVRPKSVQQSRSTMLKVLFKV